MSHNTLFAFLRRWGAYIWVTSWLFAFNSSIHLCINPSIIHFNNYYNLFCVLCAWMLINRGKAKLHIYYWCDRTPSVRLPFWVTEQTTNSSVLFILSAFQNHTQSLWVETGVPSNIWPHPIWLLQWSNHHLNKTYCLFRLFSSLSLCLKGHCLHGLQVA